MKVSARLKVGQWRQVDEVGDVAFRTRSTRFRRYRRSAAPARPETADGGSRSGRSAAASSHRRRRWRCETSSSRSGKMPKAMPVLRTWRMSRNGSTRATRRAPYGATISRFVTWSATMTTVATASSPAHCREPAHGAPARDGAVARSAPFLCSFALDAPRRVGQRLQPLVIDRVAAPVAAAVGPASIRASASSMLAEQVLGVVLQRDARSRGRASPRRCPPGGSRCRPRPAHLPASATGHHAASASRPPPAPAPPSAVPARRSRRRSSPILPSHGRRRRGHPDRPGPMGGSVTEVF